MKYSDILNNNHFNNLAAIIRIPCQSEDWRRQHPEMAFWNQVDGLNKIKTEQHFAKDRAEFVSRFCEFLTSLTETDPRLAYTADDLAWFVGAMDTPEALIISSLLFAWFSAPDTMLTPVEVASITGTAESTWRNKAASGNVPGAIKKGKQWLLPASVLRAQGIIANIPRQADDRGTES